MMIVNTPPRSGLDAVRVETVAEEELPSEATLRPLGDQDLLALLLLTPTLGLDAQSIPLDGTGRSASGCDLLSEHVRRRHFRRRRCGSRRRAGVLCHRTTAVVHRVVFC